MGAVRTYRASDLKKLFALSYNQCALHGCDERLADAAWPRVLAEVCHIYGLNQGSARYVAGLDPLEANSYENLILLCRNCHVKVDDLYQDQYPAERLLEIKAAHEQRQTSDKSWCSDGQLARYVGQLAEAIGAELDHRPPPTPQPKRYGERVSGVVKFFNGEKGFGFLSRDDGGEDLFVHFTNIDGDGYKTLEDGQRVEFEPAKGRKGDEAVKVRAV